MNGSLIGNAPVIEHSTLGMHSLENAKLTVLCRFISSWIWRKDNILITHSETDASQSRYTSQNNISKDTQIFSPRSQLFAQSAWLLVPTALDIPIGLIDLARLVSLCLGIVVQGAGLFYGQTLGLSQ